LPQEDHAEQACMAALEMRRRLVELQRIWADAGRPALDARIGVNSGLMLVGNMGSSYRFSYGVLGDDVNLASRLEGLSGIYGTRILIGENTVGLIDDAFVLRYIDLVAVKGRDKPVRIYELLGPPGTNLSDAHALALECYANGLDAYFNRRWREAMRFFERALSHLPGDGPSRLMIERCSTYEHEPPDSDWSGVFQHSKKR
jgi:adenylate cyclase